MTTKKARNGATRRLCGRPTVQCRHCTHHRRGHSPAGCAECPKAKPCQKFEAKPCDKPPMRGREGCRLHGGRSLIGPAHPGFIDGRHGKYLPKNLGQRYADALKDPQLVSVRAELALLDIRVGELLGSIGKTGSVAVLGQIKGKMREFRAAGARGKAGVRAARVSLQQLEDLIERGVSAATTWDELRETIDLRRKLAEAEGRREKDSSQTISIQQAVLMMALLVKKVGEHVTDRNALNAIVTQYHRLVGEHGGEGAAGD